MFRSKVQSAASKLGAAVAAVLLLLVSASVLTFGFFLSLTLLAVSIVWSIFGRRGRAPTQADDDSVIDLSKADYHNVG